MTATNPSGRDVRVSFEADTRLANVSVSITGAESATLAGIEFTETGTGPSVYAATYAAGTDGTYTVTVDAAVDAAGNDGAAGVAATHDYADPGNYTVSLTVTDAAGNVDVESRT